MIHLSGWLSQQRGGSENGRKPATSFAEKILVKIAFISHEPLHKFKALSFDKAPSQVVESIQKKTYTVRENRQIR